MIAKQTETLWLRIKEERTSHDVKLALPLAAAKLMLRKHLPRPFLRKARNVFYWYLKRRIRRDDLVIPIAKRVGFVVQAGPFAGMRYPEAIVRAAIDSVLLPKLLGAYELECNPFIEEICARTYDQVINIGAAEGYYAVGLARRMRAARIIAYESEAESRQLCRELARLNEVTDRVEFRGTCSRESLAGSLVGNEGPKRTVILCDCEGGELQLLRPDLIPSLAYADLLVELHDFIDPHISKTIMERFATTHHLRLVGSRDRVADAYPQLDPLSKEDRAFLISEHRKGGMEWLFCNSHANKWVSGTARGR
jgi:hypothetical protein